MENVPDMKLEENLRLQTHLLYNDPNFKSNTHIHTEKEKEEFSWGIVGVFHFHFCVLHLSEVNKFSTKVVFNVINLEKKDT